MRLLIATFACCVVACASARAEKSLLICSGSTFLEMVGIEKDTERKAATFLNMQEMTRETFALTPEAIALLDRIIADVQRRGYRCDRQPPQ